MNKSEAAFETLMIPGKALPIVLSGPRGVRTDIEFHIRAVCELINVILNQMEILQSESQHRDDMPSLTLYEEVRRFEIQLIQRALNRTGGSQVLAAELLGVNATTLNAKIKRYHLKDRISGFSGFTGTRLANLENPANAVTEKELLAPESADESTSLPHLR